MIGLTALNVFVSPVVALGLALRVEGSAWGPHWLGICDAALAAGAILGSLAAIRWQPTYAAGNAFRILVVQGVALAVVGVPFIPVVLAAMFTVGVTAGMASVWLSGAFLKAIDPAYTGRVSSVTALGDMTLMPLSMPLLGALAGATSVLTSTLRVRAVDVGAVPVVRDATGDRHPDLRSGDAEGVAGADLEDDASVRPAAPLEDRGRAPQDLGVRGLGGPPPEAAHRGRPRPHPPLVDAFEARRRTLASSVRTPEKPADRSMSATRSSVPNRGSGAVGRSLNSSSSSSSERQAPCQGWKVATPTRPPVRSRARHRSSAPTGSSRKKINSDETTASYGGAGGRGSAASPSPTCT